MRFLIIIFLLSTIIAILPSNVTAVDQPCCNPEDYFQDGVCKNPFNGGRIITNCNSGEICVAAYYGPYCDGSLCRTTLGRCIPDPNSANSDPNAGACPFDPTQNYIPTALGCIPTQPGALASATITLLIGIGSGLALFFIIFGSGKLILSQGNPEAINQAKEVITSAIIGLVFIVLSVTILQIVGFDILRLGELGLGAR